MNRYVGSFFVKASGKPSDIVERLNEIAGFPSDEDIELYEVRNGFAGAPELSLNLDDLQEVPVLPTYFP
jgi:hypothetical protein